MPGLQACGRRWDLGSDDLVFPAFAVLLVRLVWITILAVMFGIHQGKVDCEDGDLFKTYYIGMLVILSLHVIVDLCLIYCSAKGSITNLGARRRVPSFIYIKLALFIPEIAWLVLGTYWGFFHSQDCHLPEDVVIAIQVLVILGWILIFFLLIGILFVFDPLGSKSKVGPQMNDETDVLHSATKSLWQRRCKFICCCAACDDQSKDAFNDVAELVAQYFAGMDLVPTDIAAGLILVQSEQKSHPKTFIFEPVNTYSQPRSSGVQTVSPDYEDAREFQERDILEQPFPDPKEWMTIHLAAHYMKFAMAAYGWPMYIFMKPLRGCFDLCGYCKCCRCTKPNNNIIDDNCCGCNTATILKVTGIEEQDIIYSTYCNRIYETPFYVAIDRAQKSVVICLRGTLSLKDALTDMTADSVKIEIPGYSEHCYAHKGMYHTAKFVKTKLEQLDLINAAFQMAGDDYNLVVTGHSLGAGTAAILSILLKPDYPQLKCFSFSPPGGLLSLVVSRYTEEFICSVVVGQDIVPRLSIASMEELKAQVLRVIRDSEMPKYKILMKGFLQTVTNSSDEIDPEGAGSPSRRRLLRSGATGLQYTGNQDEIQQNLEEAILSCTRMRSAHPPLYPPGHILFLDEEEPSSSCMGTATYEAAWSRAEHFTDVMVSPKMIADHIPDLVSKALDQVSERHMVPQFVVKKKPIGQRS